MRKQDWVRAPLSTSVRLRAFYFIKTHRAASQSERSRRGGSVLDDEQYEGPDQARAREHSNAEEIGCYDGTPMSIQERLPRHRLFMTGAGSTSLSSKMRLTVLRPIS
jgi:hypothetical protein